MLAHAGSQHALEQLRCLIAPVLTRFRCAPPIIRFIGIINPARRNLPRLQLQHIALTAAGCDLRDFQLGFQLAGPLGIPASDMKVCTKLNAGN